MKAKNLLEGLERYDGYAVCPGCQGCEGKKAHVEVYARR